ncbi:ribonuclease H-like YkuK family protein [Tepidibacillus sp. LV47]|uniref:ribonuclease H-like YkuK family protein n=1 Tax=Tepidibacillus sp. LV47 TaxID=3398228 RepID=UPI003AB0F408
MRSITYGEVSFERMCQIISNYISNDKGQEYKISVGTDSQNFDLTKTVIVVAVWNVGKGGIFFYDIKRVRKITNLRQKIFYETSQSIEKWQVN